MKLPCKVYSEKTQKRKRKATTYLVCNKPFNFGENEGGDLRKKK